jgi:hypothetical protein
MFISVACASLCKLITNDGEHILAARDELIDEVPAVHEAWTDDIDFLSSIDAHARFCTS